MTEEQNIKIKLTDLPEKAGTIIQLECSCGNEARYFLEEKKIGKLRK